MAWRFPFLLFAAGRVAARRQGAAIVAGQLWQPGA